MSRQIASLSLDLDNQWSYMKTHGDEGWESFPSYLEVVIPRVLRILDQHQLKITFFVVGQDAALESHLNVLKSVTESGHEIGNHSFHHEPWLHLYSPDELRIEFDRAEEAILRASGERVRGFRGPGFSFSPQVIEELVRRGYEYDCSTFPTFLGPVARLYYFFTAKLSRQQRCERKQLFGKLSEGFRPLRPYLWKHSAGSIVEIPVTTMPVFKLPIHLSYVLYLSQYSRSLARWYFSLAVWMCRIFRVEFSLLLHPLDFLGTDDAVGLDFFPAMNRTHNWKCSIVDETLSQLGKHFEVVPMRTHAAIARERLSKCATSTAGACEKPLLPTGQQ